MIKRRPDDSKYVKQNIIRNFLQKFNYEIRENGNSALIDLVKNKFTGKHNFLHNTYAADYYCTPTLAISLQVLLLLFLSYERLKTFRTMKYSNNIIM